MKEYDPKDIEKKWQETWEKSGIYEAKDNSDKPKWYSLIEFPYPSGDGLHVGHPRPYIGMDVVSRKRRMQGYEVLYPIGWDAFGLPTENYAIKTGRDPREVTKENTDTFRRQIKSLAISFDWSREINTTDPKYYKWTQWIFLQFLKHGLAYKDKIAINWCPKDKIGLANEEVVDGKCERCGTPVEKREKEQWMLAITKYADRLDKDLDEVDYPDRVKIQQRNWIGRSEGAEIDFKTTLGDGIKIFTTRPDTIFGATYMVLAPEHELVKKWESKIENQKEVQDYIEKARRKSELERQTEGKEKTGVELKGVKAINPATKEEIPIFIADYVLANYGTGAIMAVPAHDERDFEFAKKFGLEIKLVIWPKNPDISNILDSHGLPPPGDSQYEFVIKMATKKVQDNFPILVEGTLIQSDKFTGRKSFESINDIIDFVGGEKRVTYKLRDWIFSRQRYWGEPIPVVHCEKCGIVPIPEEDLPVLLPQVSNYQPTDTGESPLANIPDWVNTKCPKCGGPAKRETDTMPNWAGSSWYFYRYTDPRNDKSFASEEKLKHWMPVDWYNGGMEHTTLHLLYSRFWNKFLFDIGLVPTSEPYKKRTSHGLILAEGGTKMSKSLGNVINPDSIIERYGADTLRAYEMFMGPFEQAIAWSDESLVGPRRFLERVWKLKNAVTEDDQAYPKHEMHKAIKKVSDYIEGLGFNTAISSLMIYTNSLEKRNGITHEEFETLLKLLAPFAPHIAEELWHVLGHNSSIHSESWPEFDSSMLVEKETIMAIQINGKVRGQMAVKEGENEGDIKERALKMPEIAKWLEGKPPKKVIVVPRKIISIVL